MMNPTYVRPSIPTSLIVIAISVCFPGLSLAESAVSFRQDVLPILRANCLPCHNQSDDQAGVNLESPQAMLDSDSDHVLVVGKPQQSRLYLLASHVEGPEMPPDDNDVAAQRLNEEQLKSLKLWIEQGGVDDAESMDELKSKTLRTLSGQPQPVLASARTPDGRLSVVSFGNTISVFVNQDEMPIAHLRHQSTDGSGEPPHDDYVQALAISPDGQWIYSSGFRTVHAWRLQPRREAGKPKLENVTPDAFDWLAPAKTRLAMQQWKLQVATKVIARLQSEQSTLQKEIAAEETNLKNAKEPKPETEASKEESKQKTQQQAKAITRIQTRLQKLHQQDSELSDRLSLKRTEQTSLQSIINELEQTVSAKIDNSRIDFVASSTRCSLTQSKLTGEYDLWTHQGEWIAQCDAPAGEGAALSENLWQHQWTIGANRNTSPFSDRVLTLDLQPSGMWLAAAGGTPTRDGELLLIDAMTGETVRRIERPHRDSVLSVRFSPDGSTLASSGADRVIRLWDVSSGDLSHTLEGHTHHVNGIAWHPFRLELASVSADTEIRIWNVADGKTTRKITDNRLELTQCAYVGLENQVAAVGGEGSLRIYRTDNGGRLKNVPTPVRYLYTLALDQTGKSVLVGGDGGQALLLDTAGKVVATLNRDNNEQHSPIQRPHSAAERNDRPETPAAKTPGQ